jgi:hypothetical protein
MKTRKQCIVMAIIAIVALAFAIIGCKHDEPTATGLPDGTYNTASGTVKVTINNESLLSAEKKSILKEVLTEILADKNVTGNLTINVIANNGNNFDTDGAKVLKVGATWMSTASKSAMGSNITALFTEWIA